MKLKSRPMCAICGVPVASFEEVEVYERIHFVASCRGRTQSVEIDVRNIRGLDFGAAFDSELLLSA